MVILCSTALTSILSGVRYVCEQTCKVTCFSYAVFLFFFPVKCHYLVFAGHVFRHFEVFTKNNIVMLGSTICLYINKKERTLFTCEPNFTARWPFLAEKRRIKLIFSLWLPRWSPWRCLACKTSLYFLFSAFILTARNRHTCIQHLECRRTVRVCWL